MTKLEQALTEKLDEMIGKPEPCDECIGRRPEYLQYETVVDRNGVGITQLRRTLALFCPNCGRDLRPENFFNDTPNINPMIEEQEEST